MNFQHVNVKLFVDGALNVDLRRFIELFHQWIAQSRLDGMMIDVADYRHVPQGPSVMLIGLEEDYAVDNAKGRYGLVYNRKAPLDGSNADRFAQALRSAHQACSLLEADVDGLTFDRCRFELFINDRALAPNDADTRHAFQGELTSFLQDVIGESDFSLNIADDPRQRVGATVQVAAPLKLGGIGVRG